MSFYTIFTFFKGITLEYELTNKQNFELYKEQAIRGKISESIDTNMTELDSMHKEIMDYVNRKKLFTLLTRPTASVMKSVFGIRSDEVSALWIDSIIFLENKGVPFETCHCRDYDDPKDSIEYSNAIEKKALLEHCPICELESTNRCSICHQGYCGRDHQLEDWPAHKINCKKIPLI